MKRSGKILLEGTIEEFKKHCKGADNREYLLINTKEIKKDGTYTIYQLDSNTERIMPVSIKGKQGKKPFIPYDKQYLTFIALSDGTFSWTGQTEGNAANCLISYSLNGGNTWSEPSITVNIEVKTNDKVLWRGDMYPGNAGAISWYGIGSFGGNASFIVQGNLKSLLYSDSFSNLPLRGTDTFRSLFLDTKVVNAANLIMDKILTSSCYSNMFKNCTLLIEPPQLPATTLNKNCYISMFEGCVSLTKAPDLIAPLVCVVNPAYDLYNSSYDSMFKGCTNLSYVKVLAEGFDMDGYPYGFSNWLLGVAETGTFVKSPNMTTLPSGADGIPEGWTVEDATE